MPESEPPAAATTEAARLRERLAPTLPAGLLAHIDRVVVLTRELAAAHRADVERAALMAQAHDVLRHLEPAAWLARARAAGLSVGPIERDAPVLLHGPLGALELREHYGVTDGGVLHAVQWHTHGHPDFTTEAWAMFVADKVEPHKVARWPALVAVRELAPHSLTDAARQYLDLSIARTLAERWLLHPDLAATRNALLAGGEQVRQS